MDQISAMLGLDLDDEQKARLMADQLRGRKQAADFFGMTTIPQIAQGAQQEGQDIMDSAQRGGALRQTMAQRDMTQGRYDQLQENWEAEQLTEAAAAQEKIRQWEAEQLADKENLGGTGTFKSQEKWKDADGNIRNTAQVNGRIVEVTPQGPVPIQDMQGWSPAGRPITDTAYFNAVASIPKDVESEAKMMQKLSNLDDVLRPYSEQGNAEVAVDDIPGAGIWSGKPGVIGWAARLGERAAGQDDAGLVNSTAEAIRNTLTRENAGLSQTMIEIKNQINEQGKQILEDPAVFMQNIDWIKDLIESKMAQKAASMHPDVREAYNTNFKQFAGEREDLINPLEWKPERLTFADKTRTDLQTLGNNRFAKQTELPFGLSQKESIDAIDAQIKALEAELSP